MHCIRNQTTKMRNNLGDKLGKKYFKAGNVLHGMETLFEVQNGKTDINCFFPFMRCNSTMQPRRAILRKGVDLEY